MAWTSPRTWVAGENVTAALMNTHIRDNQKALSDAWTSYTPSWTASGTNPVIGNGSIVGAYRQIGKAVDFRITVTMGSTTSYGTGGFRLSLPVASANFRWVQFGDLVDASAGTATSVRAIWDNAVAALVLLTPATTAGNPDRTVASTVPFTWATSDIIAISGSYEAA